MNHGPSQSGHYSRVRDLLATFTLNFFTYCAAAMKTVLPLSECRGAQDINRLSALG